MEREARRGPLYAGVRLLLFAFALVGLFGTALRAQEIRIKVLDGRNGRPVTNECVNVWVEGWRNFNLVIPTSREGVATLHLRGDPTNRVTKGRCRYLAAPYGDITQAKAISAFADYYVDCQVYSHGPRGNLAPIYYPIKEILEGGIGAGNTCGKVEASPKPGELILFVRPRTFWERLRQ